MKRIAEEAQEVADSIADELKTMMSQSGQTKRIEGEYKITFTDCTRKDLNKKALQEGVFTCFDRK